VSKRFRRQLLRDLRELIHHGYACKPVLKRPRQRWRAIVRLKAKQVGLGFADVYVVRVFGAGPGEDRIFP